MNSESRIEVCGGIATGKTTLAKAMAREAEVQLVLEDFRANPFWQRFYASPTEYFAEKNICFIAQHCGELKAATGGSPVVCDYGVLQDLSYARLSGDVEHARVMRALFDHLYRRLPPPTLIVHLRADPLVQLSRIRARARSEERSITTEYLIALNRELEAVLGEIPPPCDVRVLRSDELDFANDESAAREIARELLSKA